MGKGKCRVERGLAGSETCGTNPIWGLEAPGLPRRFAPRNDMLRIGDFGLKQAGPRQVPEGKCAKRTQFGGRIVRNEPNFAPAGRQMRKTKPNLGGPGDLDKGGERAAMARPEGKCAEQTQSALRCREAKFLVERELRKM
jgi:hypothetical protein